jgi:List-Bact-rpt repeat protein
LPRASHLPLALLCAAVAAALAAPGTAVAGTWCGNDVAEANRLPEIVSGNQIHVIYAFPADGADRFSQVASGIVSDLEAIDAWWRSQDASRAPRFDLFPFPGCAPGLGRLDLTKVRLPQPAARYGEPFTLLREIGNDLAATPYGVGEPWAKYLVYYDGPVATPNICGVSHTPSSLNVARTISSVFLQTCPDDLGTGNYRAWTAAHELAHNLGAVPAGAPHLCSGSGHACDHELDASKSVTAVFGPSRYRLSLAVAGSGTIRTSEGTSCARRCSSLVGAGLQVRLRAQPRKGHRFVRWSGACRGRRLTCTVTLSANRSVRAHFARRRQA